VNQVRVSTTVVVDLEGRNATPKTHRRLGSNETREFQNS
jgi:hypothetical protein